MYPYPVHHPYDTYSMVDLEKPDLGQWPHNSHVKGLCCILKPGDVLYLPAYWYVPPSGYLLFGDGKGHWHTAGHRDSAASLYYSCNTVGSLYDDLGALCFLMTALAAVCPSDDHCITAGPSEGNIGWWAMMQSGAPQPPGRGLPGGPLAAPWQPLGGPWAAPWQPLGSPLVAKVL